MVMLGSSVVAVSAAFPAFAQENASDVESVVVSGSRISIQGYQAPTPVTVIGVEQLNRDAKVSIGDSIRELPSVGPSVSMNNGGNSNNASQGDAGIDTINLRNLGIARTLILFDGQRVVSSNLLGGGVDLSTIPASLVKRVDIVTGGASAAYGSDAVAGVVNLILDKEFVGFKGNAQFSDGTSLEHRQTKLEGSWGTTFDGDRGHVILSGAYTLSPDSVFQGQADWWNNTQLVQNPNATATNGQPIFVHQSHIGNAQYTQGGLVTASTANGAGVPMNALRGIQFTGPSGAPTPFNFGTVYNGTVCYNGCSANETNNPTRYNLLAVPYHQSTVFGYASYQVTPDIKASLQLNYGLNSEQSTAALRLSANRIYADNAYLDPSVAARLGSITYPGNNPLAQPNQYLTVGTQNLNNMNTSNLTMSNLCGSVGQPCNTNNRALMRGVISLDGKLGDDWSWNAYVQHGGIRERQHLYNNTSTTRYNFAVDAVRVTPTNVGSSGLPVGSIQCRALVAGNAAAAGCQPLNTLGTGVVSQGAYLYTNPGRDPSSGIVDDETIILNQDVFSGSMQGVLPWELPAGKVAVAFGTEYRHEQAGVTQANSIPGGWAAGNFVPYRGQYNVEEGFLEVDAPLLKDNFVQTLNLNAAGRMTSYSTSGLVETWKLGLTSQVNDDIRLRTTWSLDIRAPLVSDLFSPGTPASQTCTYPANQPSYQCFQLQAGNANLQPEKAVTVSGGIVLTPHWIDGLTLSADWYSINIHGSIFSTGYQSVLNRCGAGEQIYCGQITTNAAGQATLVNVFPLNAATDSVSGLDFQTNYTTGLMDGTLDLLAVGNYTDQQSRTALGITYDSAGALGGSPDSYANSQPKFRSTLSATYNEGPWSGTVQTRLIGSARLSNGTQGQPGIIQASLNGTGGLTAGTIMGVVDDNSIPFMAYLDLRGSYNIDDHFQIYGAMDNLLDTAPPIISSTQGGSSTNALIYDALGRAVRVGVRINY
jgi:outer membrane receptor protein involved in Fe transport